MINITELINYFSFKYRRIFETNLAIGFFAVFCYFIKIKYLPVNDITYFIVISIFVALLSFIFFGSLFLCAFLAPYLWIKTILCNVKTCDWIVGRDSLEHICTIANTEETQDKEISKSLSLRLFTIYIIFTIPFTTTFCFAYWNNKSSTFLKLSFICLLCIFITQLISLKLENKTDKILKQIEHQKGTEKYKFWNLKANITNLILTIIISITSSIFISICVLMIYFLISPIPSIFSRCIFIIAVTSFSATCLISSNVLQTLKYSISRLILLVMLLVLFPYIENLVSTTMHIAALGSFKATLEIDNDTCNIFSKNGYKINCEKNKATNQLNNIDVIWRGNEYYIKFEDKNKKAHYLIVPSIHILGVTLIDKKQITNQ